MLTKYTRQFTFAGIVVSALFWGGCTPQEQAFASGAALGTVGTAMVYSHPYYYDRPYYYYSGYYYYGGYYKNGYYYYRGRRFYGGHYYHNGYRYYNGRRYRAEVGRYGYYQNRQQYQNRYRYVRHTSRKRASGTPYRTDRLSGIQRGKKILERPYRRKSVDSSYTKRSTRDTYAQKRKEDRYNDRNDKRMNIGDRQESWTTIRQENDHNKEQTQYGSDRSNIRTHYYERKRDRYYRE